MTDNPNTELLEGMQCPNRLCRSYGPFKIQAASIVLVSDDGTEEISNSGGYEWDDESNCSCDACDHAGQVKDFTTDKVDPLRAALRSLIDASDALTSAIDGTTDQFEDEKSALMAATSAGEKAL